MTNTQETADPFSRVPVPSLFDWAGGMPTLERLTARFYDKVREDELLAPVFAKMSPDHPRHVAHFLAEVLRGPAIYTAERGGPAAMVSRHLCLRLTQGKGQALSTLL